MDNYKILKQLEIREKRANPYKFYDKDELIDEILKLEDKIEEVIDYIDSKKSYTTIKKPTDKYVDGKVIFEEVDEDILYESMINELLEILDKVGDEK